MNKTIVVVGASRGIGEAMVKQFASDTTNQVWALARNFDRMEEVFKGIENVHPLQIDLGYPSIEEQLALLLDNCPKIDVLINNAGYLVNKPFEQLTHDDLTLSYQINVIGVIQTVQALMEPMRSGAHVVNISSMGGYQGSVKFPGLTAYSTSKAALCSFTELFAEEHKDSNIKMNCLCLGAVQTEMLEEAFPGYQAPLTAKRMAEYIVHFALHDHHFMNGKIVPVSLSTP